MRKFIIEWRAGGLLGVLLFGITGIVLQPADGWRPTGYWRSRFARN